VSASPDNATERYLYRARLDGSGAPERVTPAGERGTHGYNISPDGQVAIHTFSTFDRPTSTDMIAVADHRRLRTLTDVGPLAATVAPLVTPAAEFFQVPVGEGVELDGYLLKPASFDPSKRYPMIVYVYGEAATQTATNRWLGTQMLFHRALADQGYVIASVDNRGTPTLKGAAFRTIVYGAVGELSSKEQAQAVGALAAKYSFIDRDRVGIWGWSGGGSSTLNAMFRYPDVYKVGVAVAPVPDQRLYDTIYQERYMGLPQDNADGYRRGSPISFAEGLKGDLLIVHGTGDDNVHFQGTEMLINRLVALEKRFDVMVYPNRTHGISEGPGTTVHVYRKVAHYFLDHLPPGPR
jgi:dipeptidyl-peptidase-4